MVYNDVSYFNEVCIYTLLLDETCQPTMFKHINSMTWWRVTEVLVYFVSFLSIEIILKNQKGKQRLLIFSCNVVRNVNFLKKYKAKRLQVEWRRNVIKIYLYDY